MLILRQIRILCLIICLYSTAYSLANNEHFGYFLEKNNKETVSVEIINNIILLRSCFNDSDTLNFILDSGADINLIFPEYLADSIERNILKDTFYFSGYGSNDSIYGRLLGKNTIEIGKNIIGDNLYFLEVSSLGKALSDYLGTTISGVLGIEIFKYFKIHIDYEKNILTFYNQDYNTPTRLYHKLPITIIGEKMYTQTTINTPTNQKMLANLLIDMGESKALILTGDSLHKFSPAQKIIYSHLGYGVGGKIYGNICYYPSIKWYNNYWQNVLLAIPDSIYSSNLRSKSADGSLGGELLRRFHILFDYNKQSIYIKKTKAIQIPLITIGQVYMF